MGQRASVDRNLGVFLEHAFRLPKNPWLLADEDESIPFLAVWELDWDLLGVSEGSPESSQLDHHYKLVQESQPGSPMELFIALLLL